MIMQYYSRFLVNKKASIIAYILVLCFCDKKKLRNNYTGIIKRINKQETKLQRLKTFKRLRKL